MKINSPLVVNDWPPMVLLPADYRDSSAFAEGKISTYLMHEAEVAGVLSLTLDYGTKTPLDLTWHLGDNLRFNGFVVPTQAFRKADQSKVGWQMVYVKGTMLERTFVTSEATLSVIDGSGVKLETLSTTENLDVKLTFESKDNWDRIHLWSMRMSKCQVNSLEISRICMRRIIQQYAQIGATAAVNEFFAGTGVRGHGARYLVTGHRTYLNTLITRTPLDHVGIPLRSPAYFHIEGDQAAAIQLCKVGMEMNQAIRPSECDIDFRIAENLDSLQIHVGEPRWYVLWGPISGEDEPWPPGTSDGQRYMEYKKIRSPLTVEDTNFIEYLEGDSYKTFYKTYDYKGYIENEQEDACKIVDDKIVDETNNYNPWSGIAPIDNYKTLRPFTNETLSARIRNRFFRSTAAMTSSKAPSRGRSRSKLPDVENTLQSEAI